MPWTSVTRSELERSEQLCGEEGQQHRGNTEIKGGGFRGYSVESVVRG